MTEDHAPVYFVRHGETEWNRLSRIQGQIDIPLNERGHEQSRAVARALNQHLGGTKVERFIVSPLSRARQTMSHVCHELGHTETGVEIVPALLELAFGVWEGRYLHELTAHPDFPKDHLSHFHWRPADGESYEDGFARVKSWLGAIDRPTVIVAHGAIGRCLIGLVNGLGPEDIIRLRTPQGHFCRLAHGQIDWIPTLESLGDD